MVTTGLPASQLPPGGDWIARRFRDLERQIRELRAGRGLEAAQIGAGGLTVKGGAITARDLSDQDVFAVTTDPAGIFLRQELVTDVAVAVIADRFDSADVAGNVSDPGSSYVASGGPTLSGVQVSAAGRCLVAVTADIRCQINQPNGVAAAGWMSFEVSGDSSLAPDDDRALRNFIFGPADAVIAVSKQATRLVLVDGLNEGTHTISARYRSEHTDSAADAPVGISQRNLTALAF